MRITPFLAGQAFGPDVIHAMSAAYENVCKSLGVRLPSDPASEAVAKKIIELAQRGVRDPETLIKRALEELNHRE